MIFLRGANSQSGCANLLLPAATPQCLSACWDTHPPTPTLAADTPPRPDTPWSRHPLEQTPPRADTPPGTDPPLGADTSPPGQTPPGKQTPAYGQRVAGTHPTGMHSCFAKFLLKTAWKCKNLDPEEARVPGAPPWIQQCNSWKRKQKIESIFQIHFE